jgi:hypothetical protein
MAIKVLPAERRALIFEGWTLSAWFEMPASSESK